LLPKLAKELVAEHLGCFTEFGRDPCFLYFLGVAIYLVCQCKVGNCQDFVSNFVRVKSVKPTTLPEIDAEVEDFGFEIEK
jgi:hypothetical protein